MTSYFSSTVDDYPLHTAAKNGLEEMLITLIGAGHPLNKQTFDGTTPLHQACQDGNVECVKILLDAGASVCSLPYGIHVYCKISAIMLISGNDIMYGCLIKCKFEYIYEKIYQSRS